ncbi:amino acid permease [Formicincola oecophyllae]|uniref:Amino acid permease n=2 Tax=Formicincola oecophyllae TaxID=2558361 RepID=A0A4Y6UDL0_9PROT|nr:amino acid permease [Formicincola oecophyllae]
MRDMWRTKPIAATETGSLARVLGAHHLICLGVGTSLGAGLFAITGVAAGQNAGPAISLAFILAALACALVGLCYAELSAMFPNAAGSAYSYAYSGIGEGVAWFIGWCLVTGYTVGMAAIASSWSGYLASFIGRWGLGLDPRFLAATGTPVTMPDGAAAHAFLNMPAALIVLAVTVLLFSGTKESSRVNAILVALKVGVIIAFVLACVPLINTANYHPYIPANAGQFGHFGWSGVFRGAALVFFAYIGFDIVASAACETRNPRRNMPIGILGSLGVCAVVFSLFSAILVGVINYKSLALDASPVATAMNATHMPWLAETVKAVILVGFLAGLYGLLFSQSRTLFTLAEDGLLPSAFTRLTKNTKSPWVALATLGGFGAVLAGGFSLDALGSLTSISVLCAFSIVCLCLTLLRLRNPDAERPFKVPGGAYLVPGLGLAACLLSIASMGLRTWCALGVVLALGAAIYGFYGRSHSKLAQQAAEGATQPD